MPIPYINPDSRFEKTGAFPNYRTGHNRDRFMLYLEYWPEIPLYRNQCIELWVLHRDELDENRPNNLHNLGVKQRDSVDNEVDWHLNAMIKAGVIREI